MTPKSADELGEWIRSIDVAEWNYVNLGKELKLPEVVECDPEMWREVKYQRGDGLGQLDVETGAYERFRPVRVGEVVVDAGAHIGSFTKMASERAAHVLAIEPHPRNAAKIFDLKIPNVSVACAAAGDRIGVSRLFVHRSSVRHSTIRAEGCVDSFDVPMLTIDCLEPKKLDFIKVDVEGSEAALLRGARESISKFRPFIVIEADGPDLPIVLDELKSLHYDVAAWHGTLLGPMRNDTPEGTCLMHCIPR